MKIIEDGIVFSNDIKRILDGNNSLDFNYQEKGIKIPSKEIYKEIRKSFEKDTNEIFNGEVSIISEIEMLEGIYNSISDCIWRYPHCFTR